MIPPLLKSASILDSCLLATSTRSDQVYLQYALDETYCRNCSTATLIVGKSDKSEGRTTRSASVLPVFLFSSSTAAVVFGEGRQAMYTLALCNNSTRAVSSPEYEENATHVMKSIRESFVVRLTRKKGRRTNATVPSGDEHHFSSEVRYIVFCELRSRRKRLSVEFGKHAHGVNRGTRWLV